MTLVFSGDDDFGLSHLLLCPLKLRLTVLKGLLKLCDLNCCSCEHIKTSFESGLCISDLFSPLLKCLLVSAKQLEV